MRNITEEEFGKEYLIYKNLTPEKRFKTYTAMKKRSDGSLFTVILKEMDDKRASVYQALSCMWNPFLANTYDIFMVTNSEKPDMNRYIAVTEYVYAENCPDEECLSLSQFVRKNGPLKEKAALSICSQICEGLAEFHKKGFVHRDIKPDNIMISKYDTEQPKIKIIDFGGAKHINMYAFSDATVVGTLGYQAPESLSSITTNQADIYSIGCILNYMLTGQEPGIMRYSGNHYIVNIIEKSTNEDPSHRYLTVTAMRKELEHELRLRTIDRIPLLRSVPGFRTHTLWKETVAGISYSSMIYVAVFCIDTFGFYGLAEIFIFYIIIPLIIIFNMGNLLRFFPKNIRKNNRLFFMIRTGIMLATVFLFIVVDYMIGRT